MKETITWIVEWGGFALQVIGGISFLAVSVYMSRKNNKTIEEKILPALQTIQVDVAAIKITTGDVKADHDKLIIVQEKTKGIQAGLTTVRDQYHAHVEKFHHSKS